LVPKIWVLLLDGFAQKVPRKRNGTGKERTGRGTEEDRKRERKKKRKGRERRREKRGKRQPEC